MNLSNMTLQELKKLKRDIEDEISEREESERRELLELAKHYLGSRNLPRITLPETRTRSYNNNLICVDELAERLGVKKCHIYRLTSIGRIPVVKVGKYSRYDYGRVIDALNSGKISQENRRKNP